MSDQTIYSTLIEIGGSVQLRSGSVILSTQWVGPRIAVAWTHPDDGGADPVGDEADAAPPSISDAIEAIMEDPAINALFHSKITGDSLRSILCGYALNLRANERKRAEAALDAAARQGPGPIITTSRETGCIRAATDEEKALYHKTMSEIGRAKADAIAPILSGEALRQQACTKPMIETRRKLPVFGE